MYYTCILLYSDRLTVHQKHIDFEKAMPTSEVTSTRARRASLSGTFLKDIVNQYSQFIPQAGLGIA